MHERRWVERLLVLVGWIGFVVAAIGLVVFIWGSVSPGWFRCCNWAWGLRPAGIILLADGIFVGLLFMGLSEIITQLRAIAKK